jgi:hypothetical protein
MTHPELEQHASLYLEPLDATIVNPLGAGTDGAVWQTTRHTAVKAFLKEKNFDLELECYRRLQAARTIHVFGFWVPQLVGHDADLLVIEMSIVKTPFVLDFGKVYLDGQPDFSAEVLRDWREEQRELWGDHYPMIQKILRRLEALGIFYADPKPGNIMPENWKPEV